MKKYIALDIGDVRIGVAKSNPICNLAVPLETIDRKKVSSIKRIVEICNEEDVNSIVVGIPKSLDGTEKRQAEKVRVYIGRLKKHIENLEVIEVDERYTTVSAERILNEMNTNGAKNKRKVVDKLAAAIILQNFLDYKK